MAIIAYASSTNTPIISQVQPVIDLSGAGTLPSNVQLYAAAVDTQQGGATFSFSWHLLQKPTGSTASLSASNIANPILNNVDVWGNYRLFVIATNISTGLSSERDPLKAPNSAFIQLAVKSENRGLQKGAIGEREWHTGYNHLVGTVETIAGDLDALEAIVDGLALTDLDDVTITNPVDGEVLIYDNGFWVNTAAASAHALVVQADGAGDQSVTLSTDKLNIKGTAGKVNVSVAKVGTSVDLTLTLPSTVSVNSTTATQLATPREIALSGAVSGSANFNGSTNIDISTSIADGSIANAKLANSSITVSDGSSSEAISLGQQLNFTGTANEVTVGYTAASNTFNFSLPNSINANAATASDISGLSGSTGIVKRTGVNTFSTTSNLVDLSDVAYPTANPVADEILYHNGTTWKNGTVATVLNRSYYPMPISGYFQGELFDAVITAPTGTHQQSVFSWYNYTGEPILIDGYTAIVGEGTVGSTQEWALATSTSADFEANLYTVVVGSASTSTIGAKHVGYSTKTSLNLTLAVGQWVHLICTATSKPSTSLRITSHLHGFCPIATAK